MEDPGTNPKSSNIKIITMVYKQPIMCQTPTLISTLNCHNN